MQLKTLRTAKKWSQYELAKRAGISRVHIRRLEDGESDPTIGTVKRLAKALNVSMARLLGIR